MSVPPVFKQSLCLLAYICKKVSFSIILAQTYVLSSLELGLRIACEISAIIAVNANIPMLNYKISKYIGTIIP